MVQKNTMACVGDLVVCRYDLEYFYYPGPASAAAPRGVFYMGIVLRLIDKHYILFDREFVYEILCTDGHIRVFTQWEVEVVRRARTP